jgi:hypothetical protein
MDIDECATNHGGCDPVASCTNTPGTRTCGGCPTGYTGTGTTVCVNVDDCEPNRCHNGAACTDGVNTYSCTCLAGYSGSDCATNIDDCAPNPCQNGGACTDGVNTFTCACAAGYSGTACATNIDDCATNPCLNGGACTDGVNTFTCACTTGYSGTACATNNTFGTGNDGAAVIMTGTTNLGTTNVAAGRVCADGGDAVSYSVTALDATTATLATSPGVGCLAVNDEVLLINLQGTAAASGNVGQYETLRVAGVVGATVTFVGPKTKSYGSGAMDDAGLGTTAASQRVAIVRVPNFASITIAAGATLTTDAWNGGKGGVLFLRSAGAVVVAGTLSLDGKGYRGGGRPPNVLQAGFQGESYGGLGTALQAALRGGGGGGLGDACASFGSAGGGAGYGGPGLSGTTNCTGRGAAVYGDPALTMLFFGSGGGSGGNDNVLADNPQGGVGGAGGGILVIKAGSITVTGLLASRGLAGQGNTTPTCNGASTVDCWDYSGPGGGGAGGAVFLSAGQLTVGISLVTAVAGVGGVGGTTTGGAGGAGRIALRYITAITGTSSPAANVAVGP